MARSVVAKQVTCPIYLPADLGRSGPLPSLSSSLYRMGATVTARQDHWAESRAERAPALARPSCPSRKPSPGPEKEEGEGLQPTRSLCLGGSVGEHLSESHTGRPGPGHRGAASLRGRSLPARTVMTHAPSHPCAGAAAWQGNSGAEDEPEPEAGPACLCARLCQPLLGSPGPARPLSCCGPGTGEGGMCRRSASR